MNHDYLKRIGLTIAFVLVICLYPNIGYSTGFAIVFQDTAALGKCNSQVAHSDNASAIFYNPALLNKLEGTQFRAGPIFVMPRREFTSDLDGEKHKTKSEIFFPSTFYFSHNPNERLAFGLGIFSPFGLGIDWGEKWEGRYLATKSEMQTYNINPSIAIQVTPWLSLGGGVNFLFVNTSLERKVPLFLINPDLPDGNQRFKGDGDGIGYNLSIALDLPADFAVGISYRSQIKVDIEGDLTFKLPDPDMASLLPDTKARTAMELPQIVHAGISYSGFERLILEAGLRWEGWSSFRSLRLKTNQPIIDPVSLLPTKEVIEEKRWKDTYSFNFGAEYQLNDIVTLRAGYGFGGNPVPDDTFDPAFPDSNTQVFTLGTGINYKRFNMDLAYAYLRMDERKKDNLVGMGSANGKYKSEVHFLGINLAYTF